MRCFSLRRAARLLLVSSVCATAATWAAAGVGAQEAAQPEAQTQAPAPAPTQPAPHGEETPAAAPGEWD